MATNWQQAFSVISNALTIISSAANTPGINMIPYVTTISTAASLLNAGLNAAVNVVPYITAINDSFANGLPSAATLAALDAKIAGLETELNAALPPAEAGEEA